MMLKLLLLSNKVSVIGVFGGGGGGGIGFITITITIATNILLLYHIIITITAAVTNNKKRGFIHCPLLDQAQKIQSAIEITRKSYTPKLCPVLSKGLSSLTTTTKGVTQAKYVTDRDLLKSKLPLTYASPLIGFTETTTTTTTTSATGNIGVVFVGRQAPGGHDVIAGIYDMLPEGSKLYGFVNGSVGKL